MADKKSILSRRSFMAAGSAAIVSPLLLNTIIPVGRSFAAESQAGGEKMDDTALESLKEMLGYTDAQWEKWKSNPKKLPCPVPTARMSE